MVSLKKHKIIQLGAGGRKYIKDLVNCTLPLLPPLTGKERVLVEERLGDSTRVISDRAETRIHSMCLLITPGAMHQRINGSDSLYS